MPQETNLNVSPYFDDFNEDTVGGKDKGYYKVLFKPGYPVQARELTGMQSILQNQIEQFANHTFKEGAKVIPGNTTYSNQFYAVEIQDSYLGIPVSLYFDKLIGLTIKGASSGVEAKVVKLLNKSESERNSYTLYVNYTTTSEDNETRDFSDSETLLLVDQDITFNNTFISAGEGFANTISENATSVGSAFGISEGVYYVRGYFVQVNDETILLDQYNNTPSYRVGLKIEENIITSDIDDKLTDNAQGFNNYAAPGADRLQIKLSLQKKSLDDINDRNFVLLSTIEDGKIRTLKTNTEYNLIANELARRTYDESGDYYVKEFIVKARENLKNGFNNAIFSPGQKTYSGNDPSENLGVYEISPGKAFVKGYEVETISPTFVDFRKPRTTKTLEDQSLTFSTGFSLVLNSTKGAPQIGIGNTFFVSLRDSSIGSSPLNASGDEIGIARVYDFYLESGSYNTSNLDANEWKISLYDVKTYTKITLNENRTVKGTTRVSGKSSGAVGYAKTDVNNSKSLTLYETRGTFVVGEELVFDDSENSRISVASTSYGLNNCKSVYGLVSGVGAGITFNANVVQVPVVNLGIGSITAVSSGISTITVPNPVVKKYLQVGDFISLSIIGNSLPTYAKCIELPTTTNDIKIQQTQSIPGISNGTLPASSSDVFNISLLGSTSNETGRLFTKLPKTNISDVNIEKSDLIIRKSETVTVDALGNTSTITANSNESFLPFDEERYVLISHDGTVNRLSSDKLKFNANFTTLTIKGLSVPGTATLITTRRISEIKNTVYQRRNITKLVFDKSKFEGSGIGSTTLNNGLVYGNYPFGTRVEDDELCLNVPDVINVYGVYESSEFEDPTSPTATISSLTGPTGTTNDLVIGEVFTGTESGASGLYVENLNIGKIAYIKQGTESFIDGETIRFEESQFTGVISNVESLSKNISIKYSFDNGQRENYSDYSRLVKNPKEKAPTKKIAVYFSSAYFEDSEDGDVTTVRSYDSFNYAFEIPNILGFSGSDIIDARPRVSTYVVEEGKDSPFVFSSRKFADSVNNSKHILVADETTSVSYSYYLPRIDRLFLTKDGDFQVKYGVPSDNPEIPVDIDDAMEIARITLPAYLKSTNQVSIDLTEHKRYRMKDIKKLENRIKNLEYYTTLSLLEKDTKDMFVPDADGLNKFKSGFFVDNFTTLTPQETVIGIKNSIDPKYQEIRPSHYTSSVDMQFSSKSGRNFGDADLRFIDANDLVANNIKYHRGVITLDYSHKQFLRQPFATRTENVTPFLVTYWEGTIELSPSSDIWVDKTRLESRTITIEGNYNSTLQQLAATEGFDPQTGLGPVIWGSWTSVSSSISRGPLNSSTSSTTSSSTSTQFVLGDVNDARALQAMGDQARNTNPNAQGNNALGFIIEQWNNEEWMTVPRQNNAGNWVVGFPNFRVQEQTTTTTRHTTTTVTQDVTTSTNQVRSGERQVLVEQWDYQSLGDREISRDLIPFMRSRNVEFAAKRFKPFTKIYPFFDGIDMTKYVIPKLIQIRMISGTFRPGENASSLVEVDSESKNNNLTTPSIRFRVANINHKYGNYKNSPTDSEISALPVDAYDVYTRDPYTREPIPQNYSSTSTILNVDTYSLADAPDGRYNGWIKKGMVIKGETSGATAVVESIDLITDNIGTLIGCYFIPDPNGVGNPKFSCGTKVFKLTSSVSNSSVIGTVTTSGEESFTAEGTMITVQEDILAIRNARLETQTVTDSRTVQTTDTVVVSSNTTSQVISQTTNLTGVYKDPLAQSFAIDETTGVFVTKVDLFFATVATDSLPVTFQLRTMQLGTPTRKVLPFSEVVIPPSRIRTSNDATVPTTIDFHAPVYLKPGLEYCMVLLSESTEYNVWISRLGEIDISTANKPESQQILVSTQPTLGSLFKSQNASTWTPSQYEDLKFTLYRADFVPNGNVQFENPPATKRNGLVSDLRYNAISCESRSLSIGVAKEISANIPKGTSIIQYGSNGRGDFVGLAGSAFGTMNLINAGVGYTPAIGSYVFNDVSLNTVTGNGSGAKANLTIQNGVAIAATIVSTNAGVGYSVGDIVDIGDFGLGVGANARFSIANTQGNNTLIVENVSGEFKVGVAYTLSFLNSSGVQTPIGPESYPIGTINVLNDRNGKTISVFHKNHGMHFYQDKVSIENVKSDLPPLKCTNSSIFVGNTIPVSGLTTNFSTFEGVGVGTTNPGYALVGSEIISYEGVTSNSLTGVTRGIDSNEPITSLVAINALPNSSKVVFKYEFNGVSLRRINTDHTLTNAQSNTLDEYTIDIDMSDAGKGSSLPQGQVDRTSSESSGFPSLYFNKTVNGFSGGASASQNLQYQLITPNVHNFTVAGTTVSAALKTISGTTPGSSEPSFVDQGFQEITLNEINYFDTPRVVASDVNERENIINSDNNKSLTLSLNLATSDSRVTPVLDKERVLLITTSNRIDNQITNFIQDSRVNTLTEDPSAFQYVTKTITLATPARSLKVLFNAYINVFSDVRVLYSISNDANDCNVFTLFPGYSNIDRNTGEIIDKSKSDGTPDKYIEKSQILAYDSRKLTFTEYEFTADPLPEFTNYRIKVVFSGTNQAFPPRMREFRAIALA